ncbi:MAG TPA: CPBP family intramembrane glutamic endopeptidase [Pirellulales bacterium]|nr:CPBP family intramembrane glutamic endopeptidase [Pirellulales bacterium]
MDGPTIVLAALLTALSVAAWTAIARRWRKGLPSLPLTPRRPAPWKGIDVLFVALVYLLSHVACQFLVAMWMPGLSGGGTDSAEQFTAALAIGMVASLLACGFAVVWLSIRAQVTAEDLGWRSDYPLADVRLGLVAFAAVAAPVYGLQAFLSQFVEEQHPIIEILQKHPSPLLYLLGGLSAVVVAPIAEEFFFRALLQGWLETLLSPFEMPLSEAGTLEHRPWPGAIVVASLMFAALHLGQGAAPIPLFFLSLALGYLYQRTHRLVPCITLHFCINACSFALLCFSR